ncbi:MAG: hypothetical protein FJ267_03725 [Planctomycetes bacterium]|nr:hypothetical protein [Planctomycetota bacterium]
MSKQPPTPNSPKSNDDESWGKLATDLLGIQFGSGADDDDDLDLLEDDDRPTSVQKEGNRSEDPTCDVQESSNSADLFSLVKEQLETGDSLPGGSASEAEIDKSESRGEDEKDIWDLLGDWNWDEPASTTGKSGKKGFDRPEGAIDRDKFVSGKSSDSHRESSRSRPDKPVGRSPQLASDDEFAAGLEESTSSTFESKFSLQRNSQSTSQPKNVAGNDGSLKNSIVDSDFAADLFVDSDDDAIELGAQGDAPASESENGLDGDEQKSRRNRRRRRRGRGKGRRTDVAGTSNDFAESDSTPSGKHDLLSDFQDDDLTETADESSSDCIEEPSQIGESNPKRPRRGKRRGRRRFDERTSRGENFDREESRSNSTEFEGTTVDELGSRNDSEEEPLVPVSYEGIPTWEEAISYLVRIRAPDSRSRGNGNGGRGRGGPSHRR